MTPFRGFLTAFTLTLSILFAGHALAVSMMPEVADNVIQA